MKDTVSNNFKKFMLLFFPAQAPFPTPYICTGT